MAIVKIGKSAINMEAVTWAEDTTELYWPTPEAPKADIPIVRVHFIGGSAVKLYGRDADEARRVFGLVDKQPVAVTWAQPVEA